MIWGLLFGLGWPLLTVLTGRKVYAMFRADEIENDYTWDLEDRAFIGAISTALGVVWPLVGLWVLVTSNPPKTPKEEKAKRDAEAKEHEDRISRLQRENAELERSLRLGDHK